MQTTYQLNMQELGTAFIKSLKTLLPNQEVDITMKTLTTPDEVSDENWLKAATANPAFSFLQDDAENIYSITAGTPLVNEV